jgi:hypothetical protein
MNDGWLHVPYLHVEGRTRWDSNVSAIMNENYVKLCSLWPHANKPAMEMVLRHGLLGLDTV